MENVEQCPYCGNIVAGVEKSASGKGWVQGAATAAGVYFGIPMAGQAAGYAFDGIAGKNLVFQCPKCGHSWSRKVGEAIIPDELVEVSRKKALEFNKYKPVSKIIFDSILEFLWSALFGIPAYFTYKYCKTHESVSYTMEEMIKTSHYNWWWYIDAFICFICCCLTLLQIYSTFSDFSYEYEKETKIKKRYDYIKSLTTAQYRHSHYMKQFPYDG